MRLISIFFYISFIILAISSAKADLVEEKTTEIHGFLYMTEKGEWVLAPVSNLKSCCVGKRFEDNGNGCDNQFYLEGTFPKELIHQEIRVRGVLVNDLELNRKDLLNAQLIEEHEHAFPWYTLLFSMALCVIGYYGFRYSRLTFKHL